MAGVEKKKRSAHPGTAAFRDVVRLRLRRDKEKPLLVKAEMNRLMKDSLARANEEAGSEGGITPHARRLIRQTAEATIQRRLEGTFALLVAPARSQPNLVCSSLTLSFKTHARVG